MDPLYIKENTKKISEGLGVQLDFLLTKFPSLAKESVADEIDRQEKSGVAGDEPGRNRGIHYFGKADKEDPNFHAINASMFYGDNGWGVSMPCPRDGKESCAFVDALNCIHERLQSKSHRAYSSDLARLSLALPQMHQRALLSRALGAASGDFTKR